MRTPLLDDSAILPTETAHQADPEALIEEARRRQRRRRLRLLGLLAALAAAGGVGYGIVRSSGGGSAGVERVPGGPIVDVRAFAHRGDLAFVSGRTLWLLDGKAGSLRAMPGPDGGFTPSQPMFSADGKWLAYLEQRQNSVTGRLSSRLWIAHADGTHAHVVPGLQDVSLFGWSPTSDLLAVSTGPERTKQPCPCFSPTAARLVAADGSSRTVARAGWVDGASWSPDGRQIAVAAIGMNSARLLAYAVNGGWSRVWLARRRPQRLNGRGSIVFDIAGWWRRFGIGIWVVGDGAVRNLDATPLDAIAHPSEQPRLLGQTLSDHTTDAVAATSHGDLALVTDHGGGRALWQGKAVLVCLSPQRHCRAVPHDPGTVTVDPAWSPDGRTLVYVQAPKEISGPWSQKRIAAWYAAHRVLLYDRTTRRARRLPAAQGATAITWSADGNSLLYVRNDALFLLPSLDGKPVRIAEPLFPRHNWPQYYGQIGWSQQFAWSNGH